MKSIIKDGNLVLTPESKTDELFLENMRIFGVSRVSQQASWETNKNDIILILKEDDGWNSGKPIKDPNSW